MHFCTHMLFQFYFCYYCASDVCERNPVMLTPSLAARPSPPGQSHTRVKWCAVGGEDLANCAHPHTPPHRHTHPYTALLHTLHAHTCQQTVHDSYFIETYLVDNSNRDRIESPWKSTVADRNDGNRKRKSRRYDSSSFQHVVYTSAKAPTVATQLSLALQYFASAHGNRTHPIQNRREDVWRQN